jgi:hypothetical protein
MISSYLDVKSLVQFKFPKIFSDKFDFFFYLCRKLINLLKVEQIDEVISLLIRYLF